MEIVIIIDGGIVHQVYTDTEAKVTIIDRDTDGADEQDLVHILGEKSYVYNGIREASVDTSIIDQVNEELRV